MVKTGRLIRQLNTGWHLLPFLLSALVIAQAQAQDIVKVGGYQFPPFVEVNGPQYSGLTLDLIKLFNQHQQQVKFQFVNTSPKRRYTDFKANRFDLLFFESMVWGWKGYDIEPSKVFLTGGEVYIANKSRGHDQQFFEQLKSKHLVGVLGYHYGFAGFNADTAYLRKEFNIRLVSSPDSIIRRITLNKSDIGIITLSYIHARFLSDAALQGQIILSEKLDQKYEHTILTRKNSVVSVDMINQWLDEMKTNGSLKNLLARYNLQDNMQ